MGAAADVTMPTVTTASSPRVRRRTRAQAPRATRRSLQVCTLGNSQTVLSPDFSICTPVDNMDLKGLQG